MRLLTCPGRGGRGHPSLPPPKYMLRTKLKKEEETKHETQNRFSALDSMYEENEAMDNAGNYEETEEKNKQKCSINLSYRIPNSQTKGLQLEKSGAPKTETKINLSKEELRALRRKKNIQGVSTNRYYKIHSSRKEKESRKISQVVNTPKCWKEMTTPQAQDVDMEDANAHEEKDDVRNADLWNAIVTLSDELQVYVENTNRHSTREHLLEALEKLRKKKELDQSFSATTGNSPSETPTKRKKTAAYDKDFFPPEDANEAQTVTPTKSVLNCDQDQANDEDRRCNKLREVIKTIVQLLQEPFSVLYEDSLRNMNIIQLRSELGKWNVIKNERRAKTQCKNVGHDSKDKFSSNDLPVYDHSGLNIQAVAKNVNKVPSIPITPDKPPAVEPIIPERAVKEKNQVRHSYTVRLRLKMKTSSVNVVEQLKTIYKLWKSADQSTILLAHDDENNGDLMIDDINKIPHDEKQVKKYVMGMYQSYGKLHFSLRMSGHQNIRELKIQVFQWMRANGGFASIDKVRAALVHTIGFFHHMQPDYYNRELFKSHIKQHLKPLLLQDDVNVFARKIWMKHKDKKIETRALVLEVPKDARDEVTAKMLQFKYDKCDAMTYIPFMNMTDEEHQEVMKTIFFSQNVYLHETERRTIYGIHEPTKQYTLLDGDTMSFQEWISTITYQGETFLEACEIGPTGNLHLIFHVQHETIVKELFGNDFKAVALKHFHESDVNELFQNSKPRVEEKRTSKMSEEDTAYAAFLKRKFSHNPQDPQHSGEEKITKTLTYAEASKQPPVKMTRLNLHYSKFSPKSPPPTTAHGLEITNIATRLEALEKCNPVESHDPSRSQWSSELEKRMEEKMVELQQRFDAKMMEMERKTTARMEESEELFMKKFESIHITHSAKIERSFDTRMNDVTSKLDAVMQLILQNNKSTSTTNTQMEGGVVTGKCQ